MDSRSPHRPTDSSSRVWIRRPIDHEGRPYPLAGFTDCARPVASRVRLAKVPQVGLVSTEFERTAGAKNGQGVGDDQHGWGVDGKNAARWHCGNPMAPRGASHPNI